MADHAPVRRLFLDICNKAGKIRHDSRQAALKEIDDRDCNKLDCSHCDEKPTCDVIRKAAVSDDG